MNFMYSTITSLGWNIVFNKAATIKKTTKHEYYEKIIAMQYNINIHVPKMNQVQMIRNNIDAKYNKS